MRSPALSVFLLIAMFIGAVAAFGIVLKQRFNGSEVQPRCSSLRADPLGAKALYDALDLLPGVECKRNYHPLDKLNGSKGSALMLLNVAPEAIARGSVLNGEAVQRFAAGGGRVIITLDSEVDTFTRKVNRAQNEQRRAELKVRREKAKDQQAKKSATSEEDKEEKKPEADPPKPADDPDKKDAKTNGKQPSENDEDDDEEGRVIPKRSLADLLKFDAVAEPYKPVTKDGTNLTWHKDLNLETEERPTWHGASYFKLTGSDEERARWHVLATHEEKAMLMERRIGAGSIVVSSDGFFTTNESLKREPRAQFLSWLMDCASEVVFDETHLGVREKANIMTLARRNHLHGLFYGGLLLFGLFVWRSGMSLVPHRAHDYSSGGVIAGHGATAGLVSLLRRGIPRSELLARCVESWQKSHASRSAAISARMTQAWNTITAEEAGARRQKRNATAYEKICAMIHSKGS